METKPNSIAVVGPTASGKSALAVFLAERLQGEVISADSRQVYIGLDIGTGKITPEETAGVTHHIIDIVKPSEEYTVSQFVIDANKAATEIWSRSHLPIVCGGSGLYIDALIDGISIPTIPPNTILRSKLEQKTVAELFEMLRAKDPVRAASIDPKNPRRLVRALEIIDAVGTVPPAAKKSTLFDTLFIGIEIEPKVLREKIHTRLLARLEQGLIAEVEELLKKGSVTAEKLDRLGLEYRYVGEYLRGTLSSPELVSKLEKAIWDYSRRQMTWFRANKRIHWVKTNEEALLVAKNAGL